MVNNNMNDSLFDAHMSSLSTNLITEAMLYILLFVVLLWLSTYGARLVMTTYCIIRRKVMRKFNLIKGIVR